jgi:hypothetical protein
MHVNHELFKIATKSQKIFLHVTDEVTVVDHTSCENLMHFADECHRSGTARVELLGLDVMAPRSEYPSCMRTRASRRRGGGSRRTGDDFVASVVSREPTSEGIVTCSTSAGATSQGDDAMTWLSLSAPAAGAAGPHTDHCDRDAAARARAEMDWIDLKIASGEAHRPQSRQAQARDDMDWLSLRRAIGGPIAAWNHWFAR